jgi:hypothetical protein
MGLKLERALQLCFQKNWGKLSLIFFRVFCINPFTSDTQRTFVALKFGSPMTQKKMLTLVKEWQKYWILCKGDNKYMFGDEQFYIMQKSTSAEKRT